MNQLPSVDYLHQCFTYQPDTGKLYWKTRPLEHFASEKAWKITNTRCAGTEAGFPDPKSGHLRIEFKSGDSRTSTGVHRVIWALQTGSWPELQVEHKDTCPSNNAWSNLRLATQSQNSANVGVRSHSTIGLKGVGRNGKGFSAKITKEGKIKLLGTYQTPELAHAAYVEAANKYFGEYARAA